MGTKWGPSGGPVRNGTCPPPTLSSPPCSHLVHSHLAPTWFTPRLITTRFPPRSHLVPSWFPTGETTGTKVASTWGTHEDPTGTKWGTSRPKRGHHVGFPPGSLLVHTWFPPDLHGSRSVPTWFPPDSHLASAWFPDYPHPVPTMFPPGSIWFPRGPHRRGVSQVEIVGGNQAGTNWEPSMREPGQSLNQVGTMWERDWD